MSESRPGRLEEIEARSRAIVDTAVDGIITIDAHGVARQFNPAAERIFGYAAHEVIGRNISMLMPPPYRREHDEYLVRYLTTGEKRIIGIGREVVGRRKDGTTFPMELAVSEHGPGRMFTGIVRDVTERVELETARDALIRELASANGELEQKNAELESFTYTVSHDLKSPLITISSFLGGLEADARRGNFDRMREDIARIARAAERMRHLLDELLELSRIGRVVNPREDVDLSDVAHEAVELLSGPAAERGVRVLVAEALPVVRGDRLRLREVFQNLVENAIKFIGDNPDPQVEVGMRQGPEGHVLYVRDNGIGIDPKYHDRVFGVFDKLDGQTPGTGIGLALARRIVELHEGRLWVESAGEGQGSTFCFTLPTASGTRVQGERDDGR